MANINDVAARAGVSAMTVSRVLNKKGRVGQKTRERVLQAVRELNYVPNRLARSLVQGRTRMIALLVTDVTNPFYTTIARGAEDAARRNGYHVLLGNSDEDPAKEQEYIEALVAYQVDGVVMAPAGIGSKRNLQYLQQHRVPFVLLDRAIEGIDCDLVVGDSVAGARSLVQHLVDLGHRRIGIVTGPLTVPTARDRLTGYRRILQEAGIQLDPALEIEAPYKLEGGRQAAQAVLALSESPTAVFCGNNFQAVGLIATLREAGLRVPDDISICCFDDVELASILDPFLTVVAQPAYSFGAIGTQLLLERLEGSVPEGHRRVVLQPSLIIRRSAVSPRRTQPDRSIRKHLPQR